MGRDLDIGESHREPFSDELIRDRVRLSPEVRLQRVKKIAATALDELITKLPEDGLQKHRGPVLLERRGRVGLVRTRFEVERLRILIVQRDQRFSSATLLGLVSVMRVAQEVFDGR